MRVAAVETGPVRIVIFVVPHGDGLFARLRANCSVVKLAPGREAVAEMELQVVPREEG